MFLKPLPIGAWRLPYELLITIQPVTPIPVSYCTFPCGVILVSWGHQEASDGITSFKVDFDPHFTTNIY